MMHRYHQLAAEIFGYSFRRHTEKLEIDAVRFSEIMPEEVRVLEEFDPDDESIEELAGRLDCDIDRANRMLEDYRRAVAVVDREDSADRFRLAVENAVEVGLEEGYDEETLAEFVAHQAAYSAADLAYEVEQSGDGWEEVSRELRFGSDWQPPESGEPDEEAIREMVEDHEEHAGSNGWTTYFGETGAELADRVQQGTPVGKDEVRELVEAFAARTVPPLRPTAPGKEYNPGTNMLEMLAYHGYGGMLVQVMEQQCPEMYRADISAEALDDYLRLGRVMATLETVVSADGEPTEGSLPGEFDRLVREDRLPEYERLADYVRGRGRMEPPAFEELDGFDAGREASFVVGGTVGELLEHGWSRSRAALGLCSLGSYYRDVLVARHHGSSIYETSDRRRGSRMRERLGEAHRLVVDPDELTAYLRRLAGETGNWRYRRGVLVEMVGHWMEFLQNRGYVEEKLAASLRYNIKERLEPEIDSLEEQSPDRRLAESVRERWEALYD
jgi:hypothetical protein